MPGLIKKKITDAQEVATRLMMNKSRILAEWDERVRKRLPETREYSISTLRDSLPEILDKFSQLLTLEGHGQTKVQASDVSKKHGLERAKFEKYSLSALIEEFSELRKIVFEVLEEDGELPVREREIILEAVRRGVADSVTAYTDYQQNKILGYVNQLEEEQSRREIFVMALTHDLKNPLTNLSLNVAALKRHPTPEVLAKVLPKISETISRMDRMITDLLDANLIQAGETLDLDMTKSDLNELIQRTVLEIKTVYGDRFITRGSIAEMGYWNPDALRRALSNLLINAVKHGNEQTPILIVLSETDLEVEIAVNNQGRVLESQELIQIFKPFRKLSAAETSKKKGWGLGLTIVRGIAEAHHGRVVAESSTAAGTTFRLVIPKDARSKKPAESKIAS